MVRAVSPPPPLPPTALLLVAGATVCHVTGEYLPEDMCNFKCSRQAEAVPWSRTIDLREEYAHCSLQETELVYLPHQLHSFKFSCFVVHSYTFKVRGGGEQVWSVGVSSSSRCE